MFSSSIEVGSTRVRLVGLRLWLRSFVILIVSMLTTHACATNYFVDSVRGNDSFDGLALHASTSQRGPWRSFGRLRNVPLLPGDTIYLACGSRWAETLKISRSGSSQDPITIAAAESSCAVPPLIDGGTELVVSRGKEDASLQIIELPGKVFAITQDAQVWSEAHHPNRGHDVRRPKDVYAVIAEGVQVIQKFEAGRLDSFLLREVDLKNSNLQTSSKLRVRIRTVPWAIEERTVKAVSDGIVYLDRPTSYLIKPGWGYYFLGESWMVDSPREWHFDEDKSKLTLYLPPQKVGDAPVYATTLEKGLDLSGVKNVRVSNISVRRVVTGADLTSSENVVLTNVTIYDVSGFGIEAAGTKAASIDSSEIVRSGLDAIHAVSDGLGASVGLSVRANVIRDSGVVLGDEGNSALPVRSFAAILTGIGSTIIDNKIYGSAYAGIRFLSGSVIERNDIRQTCVELSDCGAIYAWGASVSDGVIADNLISGVVGGLSGAPNGTRGAAQGIYLDDYTSGLKIFRNTVQWAEHGLQLHLSSNNLVLGNKFVENRRAQIWLQADKNRDNPLGDVYGNIVKDNIFVPGSAGSLSVLRESRFGSVDHFAQLEGNRYFVAEGNKVAQDKLSTTEKIYDLNEWIRHSKGLEKSGFALMSMDGFNWGLHLVGKVGADLFQDPFVRTSWMIWSSGRGVRKVRLDDCSGRKCFRFFAHGGESIIYSETISLKNNQWYRFSFDIKSRTLTNELNVVLRSGSPGFRRASSSWSIGQVGSSWARYSGYLLTSSDMGFPVVTHDSSFRLDIGGILGQTDIELGAVELVPVKVSQPRFVRSVVNRGSSSLYIGCESDELQIFACESLYMGLSGRALVGGVSVAPGEVDMVLFLSKQFTDSDRDGIPDEMDKCEGTPLNDMVNSFGCAINQKYGRLGLSMEVV